MILLHSLWSIIEEAKSLRDDLFVTVSNTKNALKLVNYGYDEGMYLCHDLTVLKEVSQYLYDVKPQHFDTKVERKYLIKLYHVFYFFLNTKY